MRLTPEQEERLARFNHYPHPEVTEADVALFVAALATERTARETAEHEAERLNTELCKSNLLRHAEREQTRLRAELAEGERDEWCDKYADARAAHEQTRAELELAQAGLLSELEGKAVLEANLATAQARVAELEREARLESGEADHYCNRLEAAESALASARKLLNLWCASARLCGEAHGSLYEESCALSTTPTPASPEPVAAIPSEPSATLCDRAPDSR